MGISDLQEPQDGKDSGLLSYEGRRMIFFQGFTAAKVKRTKISEI